MTIGLQGTWNVSVKSKDASWAQRFVVEGSDNDGEYDGVTSTTNIPISGEQWGITIQHDPSGSTSWSPSRARLANFRVDGDFFKVDIESDDGGGFPGDEDFNDLILTASKPLSSSEWIVYGKVKTYTGRCLFNPCFPFPWVVIDTAVQLERLLGYPQMRTILEREYGSGVAELAKAEVFRPMMLSRGGSTRGGYKVRGTTETKLAKKGNSKTAKLETTASAQLLAPDRFEYRGNLTVADLGIIDRLFPLTCDSEALGSALMRFQEYDRTDSELGGGVYTGLGNRETLGLSMTDEFGNYLYSFERSVADIVNESIDDTPTGGDPVVSANPDLIIQFPDLPDSVANYETAPYYDIPNVKRINLCIRKSAFDPKPCLGGGVFQYVGNIPIVSNPGSTLHSDGTVSNDPALSLSGPPVEWAAWRGTVDLIGCFDGTPSVTHYTVEYKVDDEDYEYLSVDASGLFTTGGAVFVSESYGAEQTDLSVGRVPAYRNIDHEEGWSLEVENRRARVSLRTILATVPLTRQVADVTFKIRGYDSDGNFVANTEDTILLRVDEQPGIGDIDSILVPGETDLGDCALLNLPSDNGPLEVRLRAIDEDGFLASWSLTAVKGSNQDVGLHVEATGLPPEGSFPGTLDPNRYEGTSEDSTDINGYVTFNITPSSGSWLGDKEFCAYSFELHLQDRTTNGVAAAGSHKVHDEVIGMKAPETA